MFKRYQSVTKLDPIKFIDFFHQYLALLLISMAAFIVTYTQYSYKVDEKIIDDKWNIKFCSNLIVNDAYKYECLQCENFYFMNENTRQYSHTNICTGKASCQEYQYLATNGYCQANVCDYNSITLINGKCRSCPSN